MALGNFTKQNAGLTPTQDQSVLSSNYLQWNEKRGENFADFAQQYLPELYEQEVERFGNRTLSGFLRMVGAEMPMTSDQVIWSEQNRLHLGYDNVTRSGNTFTVTLPTGEGELVIRKNQTFVVHNPVDGVTLKGLVTSAPNPGNATTYTFDGACYTAANFNAVGTGSENPLKLFVYGSDFAKGTLGMEGSVTPTLTQFSNRPIIIKDKYLVNGSDTAQIGWVELQLKTEHLDFCGI